METLRGNKDTLTLATQTSLPPALIMARPDTLTQHIDTYFRLREPPSVPNPDLTDSFAPQAPKPVTPASFALHLGFSSVPQMLKTVEDDNFLRESRHLLMSGLTQIEALLSEAALTERHNVSFTKFMLSARLGVVEKKETLQTDNKVQINILGVSNVSNVTNVVTRLEDLL